MKPLASVVMNFAGTISFPWLYAAASLKPRALERRRLVRLAFSVALCRGLIEAVKIWEAAAWMRKVFRGFMPRPH